MKFFILIILPFTCFSQKIHRGTLGILMAEKDTIFFAIDRKVTVGNFSDNRHFNEIKVDSTNNVYYAFAGISQYGNIFNPYKVMSFEVKNKKNFNSAFEQFTDSVKVQLANVFKDLQKRHSPLFYSYFNRDKDVLHALAFTFINGAPSVIKRSFVLSGKNGLEWSINVKFTEKNAVQGQIFFIGDYLQTQKFLISNPSFFKTKIRNETMLSCIIKFAAESSPFIGMPVDVLTVDKSTIKWHHAFNPATEECPKQQ